MKISEPNQKLFEELDKYIAALNECYEHVRKGRISYKASFGRDISDFAAVLKKEKKAVEGSASDLMDKLQDCGIFLQDNEDSASLKCHDVFIVVVIIKAGINDFMLNLAHCAKYKHTIAFNLKEEKSLEDRIEKLVCG